MSVTLSLHRRWTCRPVRTSLVCFARPPALSYFFISFLSPYRRPCRRLSGSSRPTQQQQQKAFIIVCKRDVKKRTHLFALQVSLFLFCCCCCCPGRPLSQIGRQQGRACLRRTRVCCPHYTSSYIVWREGRMYCTVYILRVRRREHRSRSRAFEFFPNSIRPAVWM